MIYRIETRRNKKKQASALKIVQNKKVNSGADADFCYVFLKKSNQACALDRYHLNGEIEGLFKKNL